MRKLSTTLTFFLLTFQLPAQLRTISGTLTTNDGSPLPGINILVKGTTVGTTTDANGYYSIDVPVGETLVFSFIGMQTREIVVTNDNFKTVNRPKKSKDNKKRKHYDLQPIPRSLYQDTIARNIPGVSVLTERTPSYNSKYGINPSAVRSVKKQRSGYKLVMNDNPVKQRGFGMQLASSFGIEHINKLPAFQNEYAQGRPSDGNLQWRGADSGEIFSWGPSVRTLQYDGSDYPYDKNGKLAPAGPANGKAVNAYDASSFFRTGSTTATELTVVIPGFRHAMVVFDAEARTRNSIIPNSWYKRFNLSGSLRHLKIAEHLSATISTSFNNSKGHLLSRGSNYATIIGSIYRTPATFDNANGFPVDKAFDFRDSYQLDDGNHRSHAPGQVDNPNGLASESPDNDNLQRFIGGLSIDYAPSSPFRLNLNANVDNQRNENVHGIPPGYSSYVPGRITERNESHTLVTVLLTPSYYLMRGRSNLKVSASFQMQFAKRDLARHDAFGIGTLTGDATTGADSTVKLTKAITRNSQETLLNIHYEYDGWLSARFTTRSYFSSTLNNNRKFVNALPAGSVSIDISRWFNEWRIEYLKLYISLGRTLRESPLIYSGWAYGSTLSEVVNYNTFFEATELFFDPNLLPERETKFETGFKFFGLNGFKLEFAYFNNHTADFVAPIWDGAHYALSNNATINNHGGSVTAGYYRYSGNFHWGTDMVWSKHNSIIDELHGSDDLIPLAGFTSIQSVMRAGKPLGSIYGSSYRRNEAGEKIIGTDGFPIEDHTLKMIGNPIPDWTLGWSSFIQWKPLRLSFLIDFKKGGDIWNGTNAALDYLGKSARTGDERNIANYVFEGVDINGNRNNLQVDFADPNKSIGENRWVRYGWDGVGEEYIEDASWIRLNELSLSYSVNRMINRTLVKEVRFTLTGYNLVLITPYSGVDPSSSLFGYASGNGLDLFNAPATRRFSAQITLKI